MKSTSTDELSNTGTEREGFFIIFMHVPFACRSPTHFAINSRSTQRCCCRDSHMQFLYTFPAKVTWKDLAGQRNNRGCSCTSGFLGWRGMWGELERGDVVAAWEEWLRETSHTALKAGSQAILQLQRG